VFDSIESFKLSSKSIMFERDLICPVQVIIYIHGLKIEVIESFDILIKTLQLCFLVNETPDSIDLATALPSQNKAINRYSRDKMRWGNSNLFVEKANNWHKCPLKLQYHEGKYATELFSGQFHGPLVFF
jgi:hypothetical protein